MLFWIFGQTAQEVDLKLGGYINYDTPQICKVPDARDRRVELSNSAGVSVVLPNRTSNFKVISKFQHPTGHWDFLRWDASCGI